MEEPYVDTFLFEANRKTSNQFLGGNNQNPFHWTNDCGAGIKLDIGDKISVHSSYISEIGNESATIEVKGVDAVNNLNVGQTYSSSDTEVVKKFNDPNIGDMVFEYSQTNQINQIRDDEINLTHSYYKTNNGDFYITLPRKCAWKIDDNVGLHDGSKIAPAGGWKDDASGYWNQYNSADNGSVNSANPYRYEKDYTLVKYYGVNSNASALHGTPLSTDGVVHATRREIANDGSRFTLYVKQKTKNSSGTGLFSGRLNQTRDPALMNYLWYKRTHKYKVENGFNSPVNVAESITNQMADVRTIENFRSEVANENDTLNRNFDIKAESRMNEAFPCATGIGFEFNNSENYLRYYNEHNPKGDVEVLTNFASPNIAEGYNCIEYDTGSTPAITDVKVGMFVSKKTGGTAPTKGPPLGAKVIYKIKNGPTFKIIIDHNFLADEVGGAGDNSVITYSWEYQNKYDFLYESCYATIGFKRPELQEKGRNINDKLGFGDRTDHTIDGSFLNRTIHHYPLSSTSNARPFHIITNLKWNDTNFTILKEFFDKQKLYPDLFTFKDMSASQQGLLGPESGDTGQGNNLSISTSRFIHMNTQTSTSFNVSVVASMGGLVSNNFLVSASDYAKLKVGMMLYEQSSEVFPNSFNSAYADERTFIVKKEKLGGPQYKITLNNFSVVHLGSPTLKFTDAKLGDDNYLPKSGNADFTFSEYKAGALFMDFNESRAELNEGFGETTDPWESLRYGIFSRYREDSELAPDPDKQYIAFYFGKYRNGVGQPYFENSVGAVVNMNSQTRCIGFDKHFNAYSTASLMLYNGLCAKYGNNFDTNTISPREYHTYGNRTNTFQLLVKTGAGATDRIGSITTSLDDGTGADPSGFSDNEYENQIYIGANDPSLSFDTNQSRFQFQRLHTPELVGTNASLVESGSNILDAIAPCYKINKRLSRLNWSPNFTPYTNPLLNDFQVQGTAAADKKNFVLLDPNIVPYSIMDAQCGVFIEDYGVDEKNWRKSLWELLGFTYEQFHRDTDNRLARTFNLGLTTSTPTTNGEVDTADLVNFPRELAIPTKQSEEIPFPQFIPQEPQLSIVPTSQKPDGMGLTGFQDFPTIVQNCSSVSITAENLPRKMMSPIYLIKSDIISPGFVGGPEGSSKLPVISVVPKDSGYGDYYTGGGGEIFTNTIPRTIQTITTTIVDADGTPSRVDDGSAVIYKIQKELSSNKNVIQNIFNPPKKDE